MTKIIFVSTGILLAACVLVVAWCWSPGIYQPAPEFIHVDLRDEFLSLEKRRSDPGVQVKIDHLLREYNLRTVMIPAEKSRVKAVVVDGTCNRIKPVRVTFSRSVQSPFAPQRRKPPEMRVFNDGNIDIDFSPDDIVEICIDGGPYYSIYYNVSRGVIGRDPSMYLAKEMEDGLRKGEVVPLKGDPERLAFVVREIKDKPEQDYASGVPDWIPKDFPIDDFKGEVKLDEKIVDSAEKKLVRAPVDGVYTVFNPEYPQAQNGNFYVKKHTPLGFQLNQTSKKVKFRLIGGSHNDWNLERGQNERKPLEWRLETIRPVGIPEASVSGDPTWVAKDFDIRDFQADLKPGDVLVDSSRYHAVRAPVEGVYRLVEKGNPTNVRGIARARKGAALGFDHSNNKSIVVVRGQDRYDGWFPDGKVWEWRLESVGLDAKP